MKSIKPFRLTDYMLLRQTTMNFPNVARWKNRELKFQVACHRGHVFFEQKINDFMGHVTRQLVPSYPSGEHRDKYLSQQQSSKQLLFPCQMTSEDSALFDPPPPLTPPYFVVWRFLHHHCWKHLALWIRLFTIYSLDWNTVAMPTLSERAS